MRETMSIAGVGDTKIERRLAAILAADIAGYSALMGADEEAKWQIAAPELFVFDPATWHALDRLAKDRMETIQELADEAFRDLLKKHRRPTTLREMLRESIRAQPANDHDRQPRRRGWITERLPCSHLKSVTSARAAAAAAAGAGGEPCRSTSSA
jgi:hypothetical protein